MTNGQGKLKNENPVEGDYIRIGLPAPGPAEGDGYDWVKIEKIESVSDVDRDVESLAMKLRPSDSPYDEKTTVAHFYSDEATNSLIIKRIGKNVTASFHGRNEIPNVNQTDGLLDKARNLIVAVSAMAGM